MCFEFLSLQLGSGFRIGWVNSVDIEEKISKDQFALDLTVQRGFEGFSSIFNHSREFLMQTLR